MNRNAFRRAAASTAAVLALGLALSSCSAANEEPSGSNTAGGDGAGLSGTLNGAGASSQEAAMGAWQAGFQTANPDVTVNYDPVGSGGGREQFIEGGTAFAGSDAYLDDDELKTATERCTAAPIEVPSYVSPIAIIFNIEGVEDLQLSPEALALIFDGKITKWNDKAIQATNPDAKLPDTAITPVHRSDDSGTTENFVDYLSNAVPDAWPHEVEGVWPLDSGEGAQGTSGVVAAVTNGSGTIGYADASQAGELGVAKIQVGEDFVEPSAEAASKVVEVSPQVEGREEGDMARELDHKTDESGAYPIVLLSYVIACPSYEDEKQAELVKSFLTYVIGEEGQQKAAEAAGSAPLSKSLQDEALGYIEGIKAGA